MLTIDRKIVVLCQLVFSFCFFLILVIIHQKQCNTKKYKGHRQFDVLLIVHDDISIFSGKSGQVHCNQYYLLSCGRMGSLALDGHSSR